MSYLKIQFFLYLLLILIGSSIPGKSVPTVFAFTWDKLLHVIEYFFLGVLGYRAYEDRHKYITIIVSMFGILFGCFDEIWQSFTPGRHPSYYDVIADGIGVILGVSTIHIIKSQLK